MNKLKVFHPMNCQHQVLNISLFRSLNPYLSQSGMIVFLNSQGWVRCGKDVQLNVAEKKLYEDAFAAMEAWSVVCVRGTAQKRPDMIIIDDPMIRNLT